MILSPALPSPTVLLSPIIASDIQPGSSIHRDTTERDYPSKEHVSDEYLQNNKISNEVQSFNKDIVKPMPEDFKLSNKLFDQDQSNNFLYSEQGIKKSKCHNRKICSNAFTVT
ncbi:MAG TPA: hypothetical protein VFJ51_00850 [Nitrososphaeraceae archaeon]|nr:hypothetical protein [Nitrososphaeraceae archaeon]